jgi:hypothetical protein
MSKSADLLGLIIDTATVPFDDDPGSDDKGYTPVLSPEDNDPADEDADDAAFKGLLDSGLSQEEAQETIEFMRPLDEDEREILEEEPGLEGITRVDDAEHDEWLGQKASEGNYAIDRALEDAVYGDNTMAHDEERMERNDTDSGWGFHSLTHGLRKGFSKGIHLATKPISMSARLAKRGVSMTASMTRHFIPSRDGSKAKLVKSLYKKLWFEHANWLATQDQNAGRPLQPRASYEATAKDWARNEIAREKLPMQYAVDDTSGSGMGAWFWPFSWFQGKTKVVLNNTADARSPDAPGAQPAQAPEGMDPSMVSPDAATMDPSMDPSMASPPPEGDPSMQGWNGIRNLKGHGVSGEDSLGAYAAQILGDAKKPARRKNAWSNESDPDELMGSAQSARDNPHAERIVRVIIMKLKARKPISPGELGLLSSAAKEGNLTAQKALVVLESRGVAVSGDESGLDPWMYKLNPMYWIASKRKQELIDVEKKKWDENYQLQKKLAKQQEVLDAAERASKASQAVAASQAQSADTEARLKEIEASLKGAMSGSSVGHEKIMPISDVVIAALDKAGKKETASKLYSKIKQGQALDADELKEANRIAKIIGRMRVVHGDLVESSEETLRMHGNFIGACILGGIGAAKIVNVQDMKIADAISKKLASGQPLSPAERDALVRVLKDQKKLRAFTAAIVSGDAFNGCPQKKTWTRGAFVGAVKAMSTEDKKMLSAIVKLAKVGNPRAQKALKMMKESGEVMGGDVMGFGIKKFFHYATAPIWLPAKGIYKGEQALFGSKGSNPEQVRLAKMKAAYKRKQAAQARAAAADAQTEAEQRAQQAIADAADAEADAADATAFSKEQKMKTAEAEANPDSIPTADSSPETSAGSFVGGWTAMIGKGTKVHKIVVKASEKSPTGTKIRAGATLYAKAKKGHPQSRKAIKIMAIKAKKGDPQAIRDLNAVKAGRIAVRARARAKKHQLVVQKRAARKARVISAQRKIENRMGDRLARMSRKHELKKLAKVERKAAKGDPKARAFVAKRVAAAKQGDKKAKAQVRAMQLGRATRKQVTSRQEAKRMRAATRMATRLRKNDPKAIRQHAILKAAADRGNPNAQRAMKRLALGGALVATVATGVVMLPKKQHKPRPVRQLKPGTLGYVKAKRKIALLRKKIRAGTATPAEIGYGANLAMQMGDDDTARFLANLNDRTLQESRQKVATCKEKAVTGTASREELVHGAKIANQIGDQASAGALAQKASETPSQTEALKQKAAQVAAAQAGNPESQAALDKSLASAKSGDVNGIQDMGKVMAVKTIDQANKGEPISPTMKDAINLQTRAQAGDPVAQDTLKRVSEAATQPNPTPEAVLAATAAVAAASIGTSLTNKPKARQQLMEQVNPPVPPAEKGAAEAEVATIVAKVNEGTATPEEGRRGVELAQRLGKPRIAAEISAKAPPCDLPASTAMSSLPDAPLPPIQGAGTLLKESIKAVTFSTRDPLANYREGVAARSKDAPAAPAPATSSGWSPFDLFRSAKGALPNLALASMPVMATASVASLFKKKEKQQPIVVQVTTPAAPATPPAAPATPGVQAPGKPTATATAGSFVGSSDSYKDLIAAALQSKKMSKADFNKAVNASVGPDAPPFAKKALGEQTLKFLQSKNVTVGDEFAGKMPPPNNRLPKPGHTKSHGDSLGAFVGTFVGKSDEFKQLIIATLKTKKMSKADFNKAIEAHVKPGASKEEKTAAGEKMLHFLTAKKVTIS